MKPEIKNLTTKHTKTGLAEYGMLLNNVKSRIRQAQIRATLSANAEMIAMYWDIGRMLHFQQKEKGWGSAVIPRLAKDLKNELAEVKGFSERNLKRMTAFYREYSVFFPIMPQLVAQLQESPQKEKCHIATKMPQPVALLENIGNNAVSGDSSNLQQLVANIPWGHNILLMEKVKDMNVRLWYMQQTIKNGWSRNVLLNMIKGGLHERKAKAVTNFKTALPPAQSDLANEVLKDPYVFDFLTLDTNYRERELETELVRHIEKFLLELGSGFAFVGRQYRLAIGENEYYIDLLFYHLQLRCFVVIDLKTGEFKPEYAGKMNFYCSAVDDMLKHQEDQPTIGLILCQNKNRIIAEYALKSIRKPIGVSEYELTKALPENLKSSLPSIADIEAELGKELK
jgi:predicted nuclease of restriction endonuclease-like (RecB) superfamily